MVKRLLPAPPPRTNAWCLNQLLNTEAQLLSTSPILHPATASRTNSSLYLQQYEQDSNSSIGAEIISNQISLSSPPYMKPQGRLSRSAHQQQQELFVDGGKPLSAPNIQTKPSQKKNKNGTIMVSVGKNTIIKKPKFPKTKKIRGGSGVYKYKIRDDRGPIVSGGPGPIAIQQQGFIPIQHSPAVQHHHPYDQQHQGPSEMIQPFIQLNQNNYPNQLIQPQIITHHHHPQLSNFHPTLDNEGQQELFYSTNLEQQQSQQHQQLVSGPEPCHHNYPMVIYPQFGIYTLPFSYPILEKEPLPHPASQSHFIVPEPSSPLYLRTYENIDINSNVAKLSNRELKRENIKRQIEYYFSTENLCKDRYLRSLFSYEDGSVPITKLLEFNRMKTLTKNGKYLSILIQVIQEIEYLELLNNNQNVRIKNWNNWILK
ncbi:uncharacterized protein J8A68_000742 [[Candida] subhashii]|uniref:HTH La-type RNA-binding domain-containing protein n=1 Tax=[Candida] subhashii TaxID=561895 RepID=A0A8J5QVX9_9ASCO|nr:uncharacterized protein J8A68_000742 [[Candida] subhashii]KAG7665722.1 hypothetical protein J8A68_000742 [[Candida] subhashii]